MNRKELADEIRGAGFGLRFADGPVAIVTPVRGKARSLNSPRNKLRISDFDIIQMASSCSECGAVASASDRELAEQWANSYQSFARLIWPCIDHAPCCESTPYIPVSRKASKSFAKTKARFEAEREAKGPGAHSKAEKKISKTLASLAEARSAGYELLFREQAKPARKRSKTARTKAAKRKKP